MIELEGFHGTDISKYDIIKATNFNSSMGNNHWLGDGVYFFTDGISSSPLKDAENWAIVSAWDKYNRKNTYSEFAVIKAKITVEESNFLDLTTNEGIKIFSHLKNEYTKKLKEAHKRITHSSDFLDGKLINDARKVMGMDIRVVKSNFYFKFSDERKLKINSRLPNVTILSVYNPLDSIEKKDIILVERRTF